MDLSDTFDSLPSVVSTTILLIGLILLADAADARTKKLCNQTVKEERQKYMIQKISVKKKIRNRCTEQEEYWSSVTGKDCKDKYQIVYMTEKRRVKYTTYRLEHVCCPDEVGSWCKPSKTISPGASTSGSTSTLTVVAIVVPIAVLLLLVFIAVPLIILRRIHTRRRLEKDLNKTNNNKGSNSPKTTEQKTENCELSAHDKLIPFGVAATDDIPDIPPLPLEYTSNHGNYGNHGNHYTPYPCSDVTTSKTGCQPFMDSEHGQIPNGYGVQSESVQCSGPESSNFKIEDDSLTKNCAKSNCDPNHKDFDDIPDDGQREGNRDMLYDMVVQNQGVATDVEASAPSIHVVQT